MFSGEGNECGNKVFRHFRKHLSRKGDVTGGLRDVLQLFWLYSSKVWQELSSETHINNIDVRCVLKRGIKEITALMQISKNNLIALELLLDNKCYSA